MGKFVVVFTVLHLIKFFMNIWRVVAPAEFVSGVDSERRQGVFWVVVSAGIFIWGASLLGWV